MAYCLKHNLEYSGEIEVAGHIFTRPCPECSKEMDKEDEERQAAIEKAAQEL